MPTEEQRAADYRAEQIARARATTARIRALAGSSSARAVLQAAWAPVLYVTGPLDPIARGMYADRADKVYDPGSETPMPFTEQLV